MLIVHAPSLLQLPMEVLRSRFNGVQAVFGKDAEWVKALLRHYPIMLLQDTEELAAQVREHSLEGQQFSLLALLTNQRMLISHRRLTVAEQGCHQLSKVQGMCTFPDTASDVSFWYT